MKTPDCERCQFYSHQLYFVCAVHPDGVESDRCLDFRPDPATVGPSESEELWSPEGYSWYGDHLVPNRLRRLTREEQERILDTHPFFTGTCPNCGHVFTVSPPPHSPWNCPECGWSEDSPI